jgi:SAM-dependent methyltransferase
MKLLKFLNKYYLKQSFNPDILSILINPFYIIRKSLYLSIKKNALDLNGVMLDFGCGSKPYKYLFKNIEQYIGLDMINEGHLHSKENIDIFYDGKTIPFDDNYFDAVFSSEVFEHIFNPDEILKEISRVLKSNAKGLFTIPFVWNEHEVPNDYARYTSFGIKYLFEKNGFEILKYEKSSHFFAVIVQLFILYFRNLIYVKNKYVNILLNILFISPFMILGLIIISFMPKRKSLYFNNIILVRKK